MGFRSDDENNELEDVIEESDQYDSEADDEVGSLNMDDTKSRFTDYSMSSSIIRRNENLKLLDDQFEQVLLHLFMHLYIFGGYYDQLLFLFRPPLLIAR